MSIRRLVIGFPLVLLLVCGFTLAQNPESSVACDEGVIPEPIPLAYGDHTEGCGVNSPTDLDNFLFTGATDELVRVTVLSNTGCLDPRIQLRDPTGAVIIDTYCNGQNSGGYCIKCTAAADVTLTENGTYFLSVDDAGTNEAGNYTLQLERIPPVFSPDCLRYNSSPIDIITPGTDMDFFPFEGEGGTKVRLNVLSRTGCYDARLEVWDPGGVKIHTEACNGQNSGGYCINCSFLESISLETTGTYLAAITDSGYNEPGTYELGLGCLFGACPQCEFCPDRDGDSYVNCMDCAAGPGTLCGDCDDTDDTLHPSMDETCDGIDNNCDGEVDEGCPDCPDYDDDGYAVCGGGCDPASGDLCGDCDDRRSGVNPAGSESCDGRDNDCDGEVDEGCTNIESFVVCDEAALVEPLPAEYGDHTLNCAISPPTDLDGFTFEGSEGDYVRMTVLSGTGCFDSSVELWGPDGTSIVSNACNGQNSGGYCIKCTAVAGATLPSDGTYRIFVSDSGVNEAGNYTLQFERIVPSPPALCVEYNDAQNDRVSPGTDTDFFTFAGEAGTEIRLSVASQTGCFDPRIQVWDPNGTQIHNEYCNGQNSGGYCIKCSFLEDITLETTGTYLAAITDSGQNETGYYEFGLQCLFGICPPCSGCIPMPEVCNGEDDDCDGEQDEDFPDLGDLCYVGVGECESTGILVCSADGLTTECDAIPGEPQDETCNNKDDDCDGTIDEFGTKCGIGECYSTGYCTAGVDSCIPGTPEPEICDDGLDNDCDNLVDCDDTQDCPPGVPPCDDGCAVSLFLDHVPGSCDADTDVTMSLHSDCVLRGVETTIEDLPDLVDCVGCTVTPELAAQGFDCDSTDLIGACNLIIVSLAGGTIPPYPTPQPIATITFTGNPSCQDDCETEVVLEMTELLVSDEDNEPVDAVPDGGSILMCPCGERGDVTCDDSLCDLFDVIAGIDQALGIDGERCEADTDCDCSVNIFDINCLIDCALDRPTHCLVEPCSPQGCLPSGCIEMAQLKAPRVPTGIGWSDVETKEIASNSTLGLMTYATRDDYAAIGLKLEPMTVETLECEATVGVGMGEGERGSTGNPVDVSITNNAPLRGVQMDIVDVPDVLTASACDSRLGGFDCLISDRSGVVSVVFVSLSGLLIPVGVDQPIFDLRYDVDEAAPAGLVDLTPQDLRVADQDNLPCAGAADPGSFEVISTCGNGLVDGPGEECDDNNNDDGDCCSSDCMFEAAGSNCDDGQFCTQDDICDGQGACEGADLNECSDGVDCTLDTCDEEAATCVNTPDDALCGDGLYCNGVETCDPEADCVPGVGPQCDDGVGCTADSCNEATDSCDHLADNGMCDDGLHCNGVETCDPEADCVAGAGPECDDGEECTTDSCNETTDFCDYVPHEEACDDGLACTENDACSAGSCHGDPLDCSDLGDMCNVGVCDEVVGGCVQEPRPDGTSCDDGMDCTVNDACQTGACAGEPDDGLCDDGLFCTGIETCDAAYGCQPGSGPCPPGDTCDEATDECVPGDDEDSDDDGVPDVMDECPTSDRSATVVIDGCDSGVDNLLLDNGCTISDLISDCAEDAHNHGQFVKCVAHLINDLKKDGIISGAEKGAIKRCLPKKPKKPKPPKPPATEDPPVT